MINQTHPKILGRLLMGIDAAKRILRRGEPFVLEVSISKPSSKIHGQSSILNTLENKISFVFWVQNVRKFCRGMKTKFIQL